MNANGTTSTVTASTSPRIIDPGSEGWPEPPKVTEAERRLYGSDLAAVVRLLGTATVALTDAYSLTCKASNDDYEAICTSDTMNAAEILWDKLIKGTWELHVAAQAQLRELAEDAISRQRRWEQNSQNTPDGPVS